MTGPRGGVMPTTESSAGRKECLTLKKREMKHCVFCASLERCEKEIKVADWVADSLEERWDVEHDIVMCAYHSKMSCKTGSGNAEIYLENDDVHQLIKDCMEFAAEYARIIRR